MITLPPHVQAYADELLAVAPPLSPAQQHIIRRAFAERPAPAVPAAA